MTFLFIDHKWTTARRASWVLISSKDGQYFTFLILLSFLLTKIRGKWRCPEKTTRFSSWKINFFPSVFQFPPKSEFEFLSNLIILFWPRYSDQKRLKGKYYSIFVVCSLGDWLIGRLVINGSFPIVFYQSTWTFFFLLPSVLFFTNCIPQTAIALLPTATFTFSCFGFSNF